MDLREELRQKLGVRDQEQKTVTPTSAHSPGLILPKPATVTVEVDVHTWHRLEALAREIGASSPVTLLPALADAWENLDTLPGPIQSFIRHQLRNNVR